MLRRAAREMRLDLARSWMVGDNVSDAWAGYNAGCRGSVLLQTGVSNDPGHRLPPGCHVVADLAAAASLILSFPS